jgi:putative phage-type endonuclease
MSNQLGGVGIKRIPIAQRTQAWHDWRNGVDPSDGKPRIAATTATVIGGDSVSGQTPYQLWMEVTGKRPKAEPNDFLKKLLAHGETTEPQARQACIGYTGNEVSEACVEHPLHPWVAASLDGLTNSGDIPVEMKCPISQRIHSMARNQQVPSYYHLQMQWQLLCLPGVVEVHYWSYFEADEDGETGALVVVKRDELAIDRLFNEAVNFRTCVIEDRPPATDDWLIAARLYREAKLELDEATARIDAAQQRLIKLIPADKDKFDGAGVMVTRYPVKSKVDYAKVFEELKVDPEVLKNAAEASRAPGEVDYKKVFEILGVNQEDAGKLCSRHRVGGEFRHRFTQVQGYVPRAPIAPVAAADEAARAPDVPANGQDRSW